MLAIYYIFKNKTQHSFEDKKIILFVKLNHHLYCNPDFKLSIVSSLHWWMGCVSHLNYYNNPILPSYTPNLLQHLQKSYNIVIYAAHNVKSNISHSRTWKL
jgi:hypothetical protein